VKKAFIVFALAPVLANVVEFKWFDDCGDEFHVSLTARKGYLALKRGLDCLVQLNGAVKVEAEASFCTEFSLSFPNSHLEHPQAHSFQLLQLARPHALLNF
jgi:hypothetical protein